MPVKDRWITLAQAAPRCGLDSSNVGKRARRGQFGRTRLWPIDGYWHRQVTEAGVKAFNAKKRKASGK